MIFCVFSYNRGQFLENCVQSIEKCIKQPNIVVFDDNSDDSDTINVLENIKKSHPVIQPGHNSLHHLGGLYGNMQTALEYCRDKELVCFLQDDTQIVRPINENDINIIRKAFEKSPDQGFLHPCFIRGINKTKGASYTYNEIDNLYFRAPTRRSSGRFFSALLIMNPTRLIKAGWRFKSSEPANNQQAESLFKPMGYLFSPFAMWLPEVPAYRGKRKTFALKLAEKKRGCGFFRFKTMTSAQIELMNSRPVSEIPYAEDFLTCIPETPKKPWAYNPLTGTGWIKTLNQLEVSLRRVFNRI